MRRPEVSALLLPAILSACSFEVRPSQIIADAGDPDGPEADAPADAAIDAPPDTIDAPRSDWWDPAYPVRFPITLTTSVAVPTGYQLSVVIDLDAAPCMAAGTRASARIARANTMPDLPRFIESAGGANERIWFKLPAAQATSGPTGLYLYCGAQNPTLPSTTASDVFDYHDGFEGTALSAGWMVGGNGVIGTPSVTGGEVAIPVGRSIYRSLAIGPAHILEFQTRKTATNGQYWGGWQNGTGYNAPWMVWIARQPNAIHPELFGNGDATFTVGSDISINSAPHVYSIEYQSDRAYYRQDGGTESSLVFQQALSQQMGIRFENFDSNAAMQVMDVRVRGALRPAPTAALGAMEAY